MNWRMYRGILVVVLFVSLILLTISNVSSITGHATEATTTSQVTIEQYFSIEASLNLTGGIVFENVQILPTENDTAVGNFAGVNNASLYFISIHEDSNSNATFCIKGNEDMENVGGDKIGLGNESYVSNVTTSDLTTPSLDDEIPFTLSYAEAASNVALGESAYFRFWLDLPGGTKTGVYNNTISLKAVKVGDPC